MIRIREEFYDVRRSRRPLAIYREDAFFSDPRSRYITLGCDQPFNSALTIRNFEEEGPNLALLGFNRENDYLDCVQLRGLSCRRGARNSDRSLLYGLRWGEALVSYLIDIAIEEGIDDVRIIPAEIILQRGAPRDPSKIYQTYNGTATKLGFKFDSQIHRFRLNPKEPRDSLEIEEGIQELERDGFELLGRLFGVK